MRQKEAAWMGLPPFVLVVRAGEDTSSFPMSENRDLGTYFRAELKRCEKAAGLGSCFPMSPKAGDMGEPIFVLKERS
jgi:hypothetical protein